MDLGNKEVESDAGCFVGLTARWHATYDTTRLTVWKTAPSIRYCFSGLLKVLLPFAADPPAPC